MRHQVPRPEMSQNTAASSAANTPIASTSSAFPSGGNQTPNLPPLRAPGSTTSHSVIRTLRQKSMLATSSEPKRTSFSSASSLSAVLAQLETLHNAELEAVDAPCVILRNIVASMSSVIAEMRNETEKIKNLNPNPEPEEAVVEDMDSLRMQLSTVKRKNIMMSMHFDLLELQKKLEAEDAKKLDERKSFVTTTREELYKEIVELLEAEFSCSICNEVFVEPSVTRCGHTYCQTCIATWTKEKIDCPICRAVIFSDWGKHVEMDNFITRLHLRLSDEIRQTREALVQERTEAMEALKRAPSTPARGRGGDSTSLVTALRMLQEQQRAHPTIRPRTALRRPADSDADNTLENTDGPTARLRARILQARMDEMNADPRLTQRSSAAGDTDQQQSRQHPSLARIRLRPGSVSLAFLPQRNAPATPTRATSTTESDSQSREQVPESSVNLPSIPAPLPQEDGSEHELDEIAELPVPIVRVERTRPCLTAARSRPSVPVSTSTDDSLPNLRRVISQYNQALQTLPEGTIRGGRSHFNRLVNLHRFARTTLGPALARAESHSRSSSQTSQTAAAANPPPETNSSREPTTAENALSTIRTIFSNLELPTSSVSETVSFSGSSPAVIGTTDPAPIPIVSLSFRVPLTPSLQTNSSSSLTQRTASNSTSSSLSGGGTSTTLSATSPISSITVRGNSSPIQITASSGSSMESLRSDPVSPIRSASFGILRAFSEVNNESYNETTQAQSQEAEDVDINEVVTPRNAAENSIRMRLSWRSHRNQTPISPAATPISTTRVPDDNVDVNMTAVPAETATSENIAIMNSNSNANLSPTGSSSSRISPTVTSFVRSVMNSQTAARLLRRREQEQEEEILRTRAQVLEEAQARSEVYSLMLEEPMVQVGEGDSSSSSSSNNETPIVESHSTSSTLGLPTPLVMDFDSDHSASPQQFQAPTSSSRPGTSSTAVAQNDNPDSTSVPNTGRNLYTDRISIRPDHLNDEDIDFIYSMAEMDAE